MCRLGKVVKLPDDYYCLKEIKKTIENTFGFYDDEGLSPYPKCIDKVLDLIIPKLKELKPEMVPFSLSWPEDWPEDGRGSGY